MNAAATDIAAAPPRPAPRRIPVQRVWLLTCLALAAGVAAFLFAMQRGPMRPEFDGERSYGYLKQVCDLGPRPSGSEGMRRQQELLAEHFTALGGRVSMQQWDIRHPETGERVTLSNLIVEWRPEAAERILLCCHYDTRPFPDEDPRRPRGRFIGANDGGSGVALLMELGHYLADDAGPYGIDFVFFDAEEFVFDKRRDPYFLGSEHFARSYAAAPPGHRYVKGALLDMVGDAHLEIFKERNSIRLAGAVVDEIWDAAASIGVREFIPRSRYEIRDDHLPLNEIARIPTADIIDFDYRKPGLFTGTGYWHTEADTPDKCSAESLEKVGAVVRAWLAGQRPPRR